MNDHGPTIDSAITFPYRPILLLMLAMSALSLAGAGASIASVQPAASSSATS
jgi:hypothetical protein